MSGLRARLALLFRIFRAREAPPAPAVDASAASDAAGVAGVAGEIALYPVLSGGCGGCALELRGLFAPQAAAGRLGFRLCATPEAADVLLFLGAPDGVTDAYAQEVAGRAARATPVSLGDCAIADRAALSVIAIPGCPPEPRAILAALAALRKR